jgi:anti-sigma regulatory factor (Ser/Thr protein kinase)
MADGEMVTLVCMVLDPERGSLRVLSAGHIPPLMLWPDREAEFLPIRGSMPLGLTLDATYTEERFAMPVGSTLVMCTDGLVEVPGEVLDSGLERLRKAAADGGLGPDEICDRLVTEMAAEEQSDDIAVLAMRMLPLGPSFRSHWPARVEELASIRRLLRRWLREHDATEEEVDEITVASQEACTNAIEHAYSPGSAAFALEARVTAGEVTIAVQDQGHWRGGRPNGEGGRGMVLMHGLADEVEVIPGPEGAGTTVELRRRLRSSPQP